jgi:Ser/Thr protein kinase RdoA (MazF antagonist)
MINRWQMFLRERAGEWGLPSSGEWNFLFNNNYHPHYSTVNLFWFHNGEKFPRLVTKVFPEPKVPNREFVNLQQAHGYAPDCVPRPLHVERDGSFWLLWIEGVPGYRFRAEDGCSPATLRSLVQMVTRIHQGGRRPEARPDPGRYRRMVTEPIGTVMSFGPSALIRAGCAGLLSRISPDWLDSLPVIPQHGDLFVSNVLSCEGRWSVVDWESLGFVDLPFYDLITFLLSLLRARGELPSQWNRSLVAQIPSLMDSYGRALGIPTAHLPLLLPLTLVNWFHLQWSDGREQFTKLMYKAIGDYFERQELWEQVFRVPGSGRCS